MMTKDDGAIFAAQIAQDGAGQFELQCFIRLKGEHGALVNELDDQSPPVPLSTEARARELAIQIAALRGFSPSEIVWELT